MKKIRYNRPNYQEIDFVLLNCKTQHNWLEIALNALKDEGYVIIQDVLANEMLTQAKTRLYHVRELIIQEIGVDRLERAGEAGVLRLIAKYDPFFLKFLELPEVLAVIDHTISNTAILHVQNGLILPPLAPHQKLDIFQTRFHMDFPRIINEYLCSMNTFFLIDEFTADNGGTLVVPHSQQLRQRPDNDFLNQNAISVVAPAGSMVVFDSTLWHAAGANRSDRDRLAINQQFTRSYFKQQIDYVRALGDELIGAQQARTQQILGYYTRIPTSLDDYYQPPEHRLYRSGQG